MCPISIFSCRSSNCASSPKPRGLKDIVAGKTRIRYTHLTAQLTFGGNESRKLLGNAGLMKTQFQPLSETSYDAGPLADLEKNFPVVKICRTSNYPTHGNDTVSFDNSPLVATGRALSGLTLGLGVINTYRGKLS